MVIDNQTPEERFEECLRMCRTLSKVGGKETALAVARGLLPTVTEEQKEKLRDLIKELS